MTLYIVICSVLALFLSQVVVKAFISAKKEEGQPLDSSEKKGYRFLAVFGCVWFFLVLFLHAAKYRRLFLRTAAVFVAVLLVAIVLGTTLQDFSFEESLQHVFTACFFWLVGGMFIVSMYLSARPVKEISENGGGKNE